jgi:assimilatory nitrate reductase catalytic subunit
MPMEEMAFLGALAKFGMGIVHGDGNTRQCMATAAVAYKQAFGFDAPPFTYKDFEESDLLIFVGSNPVIAHPIMWNRVKMNQRDPTVVVIDPRRTKSAEAATVHLPVRPKSDLALLYGVANLLIEKGWIDRGFIERSTSGFEEFRSHVAAFTLPRVSDATGLAEEHIEDLARRIHEARAVSFWWTMGVNQSHQAVRTAQGIINLSLITGNIGRPGTGPNSITGQANAMGSRLFSNTTNLLGGYDFLNPEHRAHVAGILGIPEGRIPAANSWPYHRILEGIEGEEIRGLWIIATNPLHSWIGRSPLPALLEKLEFLVVQDLYLTTETARAADLLLPAAGSGEKSGTFINSERRVGVVQKVIDPPGEALPDFEIFRRIAEAWGCGDLFRQWSSPEAAFQILKRLSRGQPCDISGIRDYALLVEKRGIQWPYPAEPAARGGTGAPVSESAAAMDRAPAPGSTAGERRLFSDGRFFTPDGRARILFEEIAAPPETPGWDYPLALITGRGTVVQWHTQTRTGKVEMLNRLSPPELYVDIHPADAGRLEIEDGERVRIESRRGACPAIARISEEVREGEVFMPMHYAGTNLLTYPAFDPYSFEPAYKLAAVRILKERSES